MTSLGRCDRVPTAETDVVLSKNIEEPYSRHTKTLTAEDKHQMCVVIFITSWTILYATFNILPRL